MLWNNSEQWQCVYNKLLFTKKLHVLTQRCNTQPKPMLKAFADNAFKCYTRSLPESLVVSALFFVISDTMIDLFFTYLHTQQERTYLASRNRERRIMTASQVLCFSCSSIAVNLRRMIPTIRSISFADIGRVQLCSRSKFTTCAVNSVHAYNIAPKSRDTFPIQSGTRHLFMQHAFVSNRLDCWNSLLAGVSNQLLQRLQVVQNAAARLVIGARRSEHMSPILRDLHWLPVRQWIVFKTAVLAYKCQHSMAPEYLQVYCQPTTTVACRRLRSADSGRLAVPHTRTNYGDRSFAIQGPRSWNSLPAEVRTSDVGLDMFRRKLKTFLYNL